MFLKRSGKWLEKTLLGEAPIIHGELLKLGFEISERTVSRYLARRTPRSGDSAQQWRTFLKNHHEDIAAMHSFTVPTVAFRLLYCFFLYCFFVIDHHRRKILHFNVTDHPTAGWVYQQLRAAFRIPVDIDMRSWIATPNSTARRLPCWRHLESSQFVRAFAVRGRTASPNAGWAAPAASVLAVV
jgi:hypothetical protein